LSGVVPLIEFEEAARFAAESSLAMRPKAATPPVAKESAYRLPVVIGEPTATMHVPSEFGAVMEPTLAAVAPSMDTQTVLSAAFHVIAIWRTPRRDVDVRATYPAPSQRVR